MSKAVNAAIISGLEKELAAADSCVVIGTIGMTVAEVTDLRSKLRMQSLRMRVLKNSLATHAFNRRGFNGLGTRISGPSAVVYGGEGAAAIARVLLDEKRLRKEKLVIHGAYAEGEILDTAGVEALSRAPSKKELLGMILGCIGGPLSGMAQNFDGLFTEMHGLLEALAKKQEAAPEG